MPGKSKSKHIAEGLEQDLTDSAVLSHIMGERDSKARLLHAVNAAAAALLVSDEKGFESSLGKGIGFMASCMDVDRAYIWHNKIVEEKVYYIQVLEWLSDAGRMDNTVKFNQGYSYSESIPEWEQKFKGGECVNGPLSSLSERERVRLGPYGIKSILVIPIHLEGDLWGFVSFDDCHSERFFTEDEISILRSGSLMVASAMNRHESEKKARVADEHSKLMLDAMPLSCSLWNKDYQIFDCNDEAVRLFDLKDKHEYSERFFELSPEYQPDGELSVNAVKKRLNETLEDGVAIFEWMHQKLDGTFIPTEKRLVRVKHGEEEIIVAYTSDLSGYKKIVQEIDYKDMLLHTVNNVANILLQSEPDEFESNLLQGMGMLAYSVAVDSVQIWKNHLESGALHCIKLFEWAEGDPITREETRFAKFLYAEYFPSWEGTLREGWSINGFTRDMPEREREVLSAREIKSVLILPIFLRDEFWGFMSFDDCRNERKFTVNEESVLRSGSLLIVNALIRNELTTNLKQAVIKMEEAVDEALAASKAKTNFLSNMSHEIRTPMNAIIGMTSIGQSSDDEERKNYAFSKINEASKHLLGIINDILDMSKIEANKFELSFEDFNFESMLQKAIDVSKFRMEGKKLSFFVDIDKNIPNMLVGDDQRLEQAVTNLLSNAMKFTPDGGSVWLDAHLVNADDAICTVRISVKDTGIGINPEQQMRLFTSFEQAESSTSRKYGGTGLGLAITKHIVELMSGKIWLISSEGKGSTFSFEVPLKLSENRDVEAEEQVVYDTVKRAYEMRAFAGLNVLLAEDVEINREIVISLLEPTGIFIECAANGKEAVSMYTTDPRRYDMIFMDVQMPEMDGLEATRQIRASGLPRAKRIPIIAMTANVFKEDIERCNEAGMNDHIGKPLDIEGVIATIEKYIQS